MTMQPITLEDLINASRDADTLAKVVNGNSSQDVVSRLGARYPTLAKALSSVSNNILNITIKTALKSEIPATADEGEFALVYNDTSVNNGVYVYRNREWIKVTISDIMGKQTPSYEFYNVFIRAKGLWDPENKVIYMQPGIGIAYINSLGNSIVTPKVSQIKITSNVLTVLTVNVTTGEYKTRNWGYPYASLFNTEDLILAVIYGNHCWSNIIVPIPEVNTLDLDWKYYPSSVKNKGVYSNTSAVFYGKYNYNNDKDIIVCYKTNRTPFAFYYDHKGQYFSLSVQSKKVGDTYEVMCKIPRGTFAFTVGCREGNALCKVWNVSYYTLDLDIAEIPLFAKESYDTKESLQFVKEYSNKVKKQCSIIEPINKRYSLMAFYGQSLGKGNETWPRLSRTPKYDNFMLGTAPVAHGGGNDTAYNTFTDSNLHPLTTITSYGPTVYQDSEVSTWTSANQAAGEPPNVGFTNHAKYLTLRSNGTNSKFVTINASIGGKTIEQLSKNNTQDSYKRYNGFVDGVKKAFNATEQDMSVCALVWMQGEYNYYNVGGSWNYQSYLTLLKQLHKDMVSDCLTVTKQLHEPLFITYQTGAQFARDVDSAGTEGLHIGEAQLQFSLKTDNVVLATPNYPYPDKGDHLDPNGSRWIGEQIAKVWHHVCIKGEGWEPLHPIKTEYDANCLYIWFHVPVPPLQFKQCFLRNALHTAQNNGFVITRNGTPLKILRVEIVKDVGVKIVVNELLNGSEKVWYASQKTQGHGNLCDSDASLGSDKYEYLPGTGMLAEANIPSLVNKYYELNNWSVSFMRPVNWTIEQ